jgi:hypothetical protein
MIGIRLWFSVLCMFVGSAVLSFYKTLNEYKPDLSNMDEWLPLENEGHALRNTPKKYLSGGTRNKDSSTNGLFAFSEPKDGSIKSISLLGERNTGTRWIYGHLGMCFNNTLPVSLSIVIASG